MCLGAMAGTAADQRAALVHLYTATSGTAWTVGSGGWQDHAVGSDPCDDGWDGVACDGISGSAGRSM